MIKLAIQAQLPIIAVTTRDTLNLPDVLKEITGKVPEKFTTNTKISPNKLYLLIKPDVARLPLFELYELLVKNESTLVLVNPSAVTEPMYDAGEVPTPKKMLLQFMNAVVDDLGEATMLTRALGGCTIREAAEFSRLTMARDNSLTVRGLTETRRSSFLGSSGLTQVDLRQDFYDPPADLAAFVARERAFFLEGTDHRLIPRGLLFDGPPGTGKTAGAKYIAEQWGVPLYRVDIGGTKNKYVGQSEQNMLTNLSRLDHEEPCVALLDEVEKVFNSGVSESSGTTLTMLSQLLWWLAERRSRVFVVMTTNNAKALPRELLREGRLDDTMWFGGLDADRAEEFAGMVLKTFNKTFAPDAGHQVVKAAHPISGTSPAKYSQAALTKAAYDYVKSKTKITGKAQSFGQNCN